MIVKPGGVIGILGGGQLGRMLASAAAQLGLKACIYNDENHPPAFQVTPLQVAASYEDQNTLRGFAEICDVVAANADDDDPVAAMNRMLARCLADGLLVRG